MAIMTNGNRYLGMDLYTWYLYNKKQLNSIFRLIVEIDMITDSILTRDGTWWKILRVCQRLLEDLSGEEAANKWSGSSYLWTRDNPVPAKVMGGSTVD